MTTIAFDVDGTLIVKSPWGDDVPNYPIIMLMAAFSQMNCKIYVWSGSGVDYAKRWTEKLGMAGEVEVIAKGSMQVDVAVDDEDVTLGKVNLKVPPSALTKV